MASIPIWRAHLGAHVLRLAKESARKMPLREVACSEYPIEHAVIAKTASKLIRQYKAILSFHAEVRRNWFMTKKAIEQSLATGGLGIDGRRLLQRLQDQARIGPLFVFKSIESSCIVPETPEQRMQGMIQVLQEWKEDPSLLYPMSTQNP